MNCKIMSIFLVLVLLISTVSALTITGPIYANMNQCDSLKQKYTVCSDISGSYNISVTGTQSNWIKVAPTTINLDQNFCADFYTFVTPECYANSGSYDFNIIISGDETKTINYNLLINQAHTFNFSVSPLSRTSKPCESSDYNIIIRNTSKFVDEFVLVQNGLNDSWITYPQTKFVINPYSTYTGLMRVTAPCNSDANTYSFDLGLYNTRTNSSSKISLTKSILKFTPFIVDNLSESNKFKLNSCEEFDKNVSFTLRNASDKNDELTLELLDENYANLSKEIAYFEQSKIKLDFNSSSVASLIVKKRTVSDSNLIVKITSNSYSKSYFFPIELIVNNCYDLNIERFSVDENTCTSSADSVINFINTGSEKMDFNANLYVNNVLLETKPILVDTLSSVKEVFKINSLTIPSTSKVSIRVVTPFIEKSLDYKYSFDNCFDADLSVSNILVCKNGYLSQKFLVTNKGSKTQSFRATIDSNWINLSNSVFDLNANESKEITIFGNVPQSYALEQTIVLESSEINVTKSVPVITLDNEECNDLNYKIAKVIDANCCEGKIVPLIIGNNGYFAQIVGVKVIAPEWLTVSDSNIFLLPNSVKTTYLNLSPPAGNEGDFNAQIILQTDRNISRTVNFTVHVFGGTCVVPEGFDKDTNSKVTDLNGVKVTEVSFDFVISNDSNSDFTVSNIFVNDLNAVVKFDSNKLLKPTQSMTAQIVASFTGSAPADKNVSVVIETSNGTVTKTKLISFAGKDQSFSITGWFSAFSAPLIGLVLFVIFLVIVVVLFGPTKKKKNGFKK